MNKQSENKFTLLVQCEDCKKRFRIGEECAPNSLNHKKEYKVNGQSIFLTYYDCPNCGRRHFVQIDSLDTLNELKDITKQFTKLSIIKKEGKEVSKKQSARFKKAREHLSQNRIELMKKYTGKLIHDNETDSDFELRFSI